jgi:hypothetical protein
MRTAIVFILAGLTVLLSGSSPQTQRNDWRSYMGVWVDSAQYNEMQRTRSPFASMKYMWNQVVLRLNKDTSWLQSFSEGVDYIEPYVSGDTIVLKCQGNEEYLLRLTIVNDNTLFCRACVFDSNIVLRRMPSKMPGEEDPLIWFFAQKYFVGSMNVSPASDPKRNSKIVFREDGSVGKYDNWRGYGISIAGCEGLPDFDIVGIIGKDNLRLCYHFVVRNDSILVYQIKRKGANDSQQTMPCGSLDIDDVPGRLLYIITNDEKVEPTGLRNSAPDLHGKSK